MTYDLTVLPTYSEDGSVVGVIVMKADGSPIAKSELVDALREYSDVLEGTDELSN